jgi:hypothetical protein
MEESNVQSTATDGAAEGATKFVKDAVQAGVDFAVAAGHRAQAAGREFIKLVEGGIERQKGTCQRWNELVDARRSEFENNVEAFTARVDAALDQVQERLPEQVSSALAKARSVQKDAAEQFRKLVTPAEKPAA